MLKSWDPNYFSILDSGPSSSNFKSAFFGTDGSFFEFFVIYLYYGKRSLYFEKLKCSESFLFNFDSR